MERIQVYNFFSRLKVILCIISCINPLHSLTSSVTHQFLPQELLYSYVESHSTFLNYQKKKKKKENWKIIKNAKN